MLKWLLRGLGVIGLGAIGWGGYHLVLTGRRKQHHTTPTTITQRDKERRRGWEALFAIGGGVAALSLDYMILCLLECRNPYFIALSLAPTLIVIFFAYNFSYYWSHVSRISAAIVTLSMLAGFFIARNHFL